MTHKESADARPRVSRGARGIATAMVVALTAVTVRRRAGAGSVFTAWHLIRG
jgi:hypothetical protein